MLIVPVFFVQLGLVYFCIRKILKEGVENLSKPLWILIVIFINLFGPIMFLMIGRKRDCYDQSL